MLSVTIHTISSRLSLKRLLPRAGLERIISRIAVCSSFESFPSGATEKNFENLGSRKKKRMKRTAIMKVLPFFLPISKSTFSYRLLLGSFL